jgi:iron-sulfur cluster binding protein, putative
VNLSVAKLRALAYDLGIDKIGAVSVQALDREAEHFTDWLAKGFHGEMQWLAREPEKRSDPRLIYPETKTVLVAAVNYFTPHEHTEPGKISRYAWGDDYHDVVKEKLRALLERIRLEFPDTDGKVCVDTAPIMEKAWAVRAGLGWIGKHSNLITKELGSWVFIGEVLLNVEIENDTETVLDHCGTCTACIDDCPTDAIVEPYVVDSEKCISYATIELRDEHLPDHISANLNGWLYGCDICQDVCPWNRFEKPTDEARFEPRNNETSVSPEKLAEMEHPEYVTRFRRSAMKRTKLTGLKRNAAQLIANNE